jgi:hypothetical protein
MYSLQVLPDPRSYMYSLQLLPDVFTTSVAYSLQVFPDPRAFDGPGVRGVSAPVLLDILEGLMR